MPTIIGILTFMNGKNRNIGLSESENSWIFRYFYTYEHLKFHAQLNWSWNFFYNLGAWICTDIVLHGTTWCPIRLHAVKGLFEITEDMA